MCGQQNEAPSNIRYAARVQRLNLATSQSILASRIPFATGALALFAFLATAFVALFFPGGHPPLSAYVGAIAVPVAWLLALVGLGLGMASRRIVPRKRFVLGLVCNISALLGGFGLWFL